MSYSHVLEATGGLDETPHSEGGHKLGEGGFGEVFYCRLTIRGETTEAAVKVLRKRVSHTYIIILRDLILNAYNSSSVHLISKIFMIF